jgi:hypothetical protein
MEEWIKGRIKVYRKYAGTKNDHGDRVGNLFQDPGNIAMAEKIIRAYEVELAKIAAVEE